MRGVEGHIKEERLRPVAGVDHLHRVVDEGVGRVEVFARLHDLVVARERIGMEVVGPSLDDAEVVLEAALQRPVELFRLVGRLDVLGDVPLAGHGRAIAGGPQHLGDGDAVVVEIAAVAVLATVLGHVAHARLVRIEAGHQCRAGRAAAARIVKLREPQSGGGQLVEVGRGNLAAIAADVAEAHVVHKHHDDVRPLIRPSGQGKER